MSKVLEQKQQRLKQKDLVFRVLRMFSEELERIHASSIWDIEISSTQIIENLKRQYVTLTIKPSIGYGHNSNATRKIPISSYLQKSIHPKGLLPSG